MKNTLLVIAVACLLTPATLLAQRNDTTLKATTIEVIQSYKPEVKQAPRPEFHPQLPPRDTSTPRLQYEVPQQTLYYSYSSLPLRPLALGKDTSKLPFPGYLKLGGGNLSTIDLGAGYSLRGRDYETAFQLHHLSQQGNITNQRIALSGLQAEGTLHRNDHAWRLAIDALRNQYFFYGYDHALYDYASADVRQTYTGVELGIDVKNETPNKFGIDYHPRFSFSTYSDRFDASERNIILDLPFSRQADSGFSYGVGLLTNLAFFSSPDKKISNHIIQITPGLSYHSGGFSASAGIYPTFGKDKTYLLSQLLLSYKVPHTQFSISAGHESSLRQNTFRQLSSYNPYLYNVYETRQTRFSEWFGMLQANLGDHIILSGRVGWQRYNDLPLFLNDIADQKNFYIVYDDKVNALSLNAALRYQVSELFAAGVSLTATSFSAHTMERVWHEPGMSLKGDLMYRPLPALTINAYAHFMDQLYALNNNHEPIKLDPVFDIGGSASYEIIPRLSAFAEVHNLLNNRYERWYRYQAFGINVIGGIRLKF